LRKLLNQFLKLKKIAKKTLRRYSFKKPRKKAGVRKQVGPIFISNSEAKK
jgi:hypothetical protein